MTGSRPLRLVPLVPLVPLAALLAGILCACSSTPLSIDARSATERLMDTPERYIIAAVDNDALTPGGHAGSTPRGYDELSVYGPTSHARQLMQALESDYGLREITAWPIAPLHIHCAVLELSATANRESVLAALSHDRRIRLAQPLQTFATQTELYDDPYVGLQRGFQQMDVADAHAWSRGEGVKIAIIDTGADIQHPDLRGAVMQSGNFVDDDADQFRRDRHGTEIAGVIAAVANNREGIVGIAPGSRLLIFKACWQVRAGADAARCNSFTLAKALTAALDAHVQIVNLSLSGPQDGLLRDLIAEGQRRGILFVGAAPANVALGEQFLQQDGVIEVASEGTAGSPGAPLYAPGRDILTLLPDGHYDFATGNSLATAHVTGAIALLLAKNPQMTSASVYQVLRETASHAPKDLGGTDSVDACAAVVAVVGHGLCKNTTGFGKASGSGKTSRQFELFFATAGELAAL